MAPRTFPTSRRKGSRCQTRLRTTRSSAGPYHRQPYGLVRRLEHDDGPSDEALRKDFSWKFTPVIVEWERGDFDDELVEVSHEQASKIIDYFRRAVGSVRAAAGLLSWDGPSAVTRAALAPPDLARTWQQVFPGTPDQLRPARAALRAFLGGCPTTSPCSSPNSRPTRSPTPPAAGPAGPSRSASGTCTATTYGPKSTTPAATGSVTFIGQPAIRTGCTCCSPRRCLRQRRHRPLPHRLVPPGRTRRSDSCRAGPAVNLTRRQLDRISRLGEQWSLCGTSGAGFGSPPRTTRTASRSKRLTWTSCWTAWPSPRPGRAEQPR